MAIPRPEYPRPQFSRPDWLCLNGEWQFELDPGDSGLEHRLDQKTLHQRIQVPFCPESPLSGIGHTDFIQAAWYRREVEIPAAWLGKEVLLHFQAVDYDTTVWVNSVEVSRHRGGFTPFTCNLAGIASPGESVVIVVRARDGRNFPAPRGKQSDRYEKYGCMYTRTTGIWQTVWMEPVPASHLDRPRITPDLAQACFHLQVPIKKPSDRMSLKVSLMDDAGLVCESRIQVGLDFIPSCDLSIPSDRIRLWQPGDPFLYQIELTLMDSDGSLIDKAYSYAGLRSISIYGMRIKLN